MLLDLLEPLFLLLFRRLLFQILAFTCASRTVGLERIEELHRLGLALTEVVKVAPEIFQVILDLSFQIVVWQLLVVTLDEVSSLEGPSLCVQEL